MAKYLQIGELKIKIPEGANIREVVDAFIDSNASTQEGLAKMKQHFPQAFAEVMRMQPETGRVDRGGVVPNPTTAESFDIGASEAADIAADDMATNRLGYPVQKAYAAATGTEDELAENMAFRDKAMRELESEYPLATMGGAGLMGGVATAPVGAGIGGVAGRVPMVGRALPSGSVRGTIADEVAAGGLVGAADPDSTVAGEMVAGGAGALGSGMLFNPRGRSIRRDFPEHAAAVEEARGQGLSVTPRDMVGGRGGLSSTIGTLDKLPLSRHGKTWQVKRNQEVLKGAIKREFGLPDDLPMKTAKDFKDVGKLLQKNYDEGFAGAGIRISDPEFTNVLDEVSAVQDFLPSEGRSPVMDWVSNIKTQSKDGVLSDDQVRVFLNDLNGEIDKYSKGGGSESGAAFRKIRDVMLGAIGEQKGPDVLNNVSGALESYKMGSILRNPRRAGYYLPGQGTGDKRAKHQIILNPEKIYKDLYRSKTSKSFPSARGFKDFLTEAQKFSNSYNMPRTNKADMTQRGADMLSTALEASSIPAAIMEPISGIPAALGLAGGAAAHTNVGADVLNEGFMGAALKNMGMLGYGDYLGPGVPGATRSMLSAIFDGEDE